MQIELLVLDKNTWKHLTHLKKMLSTDYSLTNHKYVGEMAEWLDTKSKVKLGRFQSQLEVSGMSSHTEELWYNKKSLFVDDNIYIYIYIYIYKNRIWH